MSGETTTTLHRSSRFWGQGRGALLEEVGQQGQGGKLIDRDAEEALNLLCVQVNHDHPVGAGYRDQVGQQAGGNGHAWLVFLVGAAVGEVGDDSSDASSRGALAGIQHDQQFHDVVADRR